MKSALEIYMGHKSPVSKVSKKTDKQLFDEATDKEKKKKPSKYLNKYVIIDGIKFQSEGEGNCYLGIKDRWIKGEYKDFKRQIPFEFHVNGIRVGKYIADFGILHHDGTLEIVDYKSIFTASLQLWEIKKALMLACYGVAVKEVIKRKKKN